MSQENEEVLEEQPGTDAVEDQLEQPTEEAQEQDAVEDVPAQEQAEGEPEASEDESGNEEPEASEEAAQVAQEEESAEVAKEAVQAVSEEELAEATKDSPRLGDMIAVSIIAFIVGLLLCLPTFLGSNPKGSMEYDLAGGVAATVNGVAIGENDVTNYISSFRQSQGLTDESSWGQWLVDYGYTPEALRTATIEYFVTRELVSQAVESEGIEVSDEEIDAQLASITEQVGGEEAFKSALEAEGTTVEEYRDVIKLNLQQQGLAAKVAGDAKPIADEEVLEILKMYYPDQVGEDVNSLEGLDEEMVESVRSFLEQSNSEQAYSEWMDKYRSEVDIVTNDMPEGLPYAIDLAPFAPSAQDVSDEQIEVEVDDEASAGSAEAAK